MEPPVSRRDTIVPINIMDQEELELEEEEEEEEGLSCKRKRQPLGGVATPDMEKSSKAPDAVPMEVSTTKKRKDAPVTGRQEGSTSKADGCRGEHARGITRNVTARRRLHEICSVNHWNQPSFELCQEQGPAHEKLFTYKVTVNVNTITSTILECFSEPKRQKKAAQEHAAEGALWYLKHFGHVH